MQWAPTAHVLVLCLTLHCGALHSIGRLPIEPPARLVDILQHVFEPVGRVEHLVHAEQLQRRQGILDTVVSALDRCASRPRCRIGHTFHRRLCGRVLLRRLRESRRDLIVRMVSRLDVDLEQEPAEESQTETSRVVGAVEQIHRVNHLARGYKDVDDAEVFLEPVADKDAAAVDEQSQLLVRRLVRHHRVRRGARVQIAR
ncbi:hypothetical protein L1887_51973 [Cichorium endivia]|nr:hypothetical protein L1887_51973 [Cichorium endivia]